MNLDNVKDGLQKGKLPTSQYLLALSPRLRVVSANSPSEYATDFEGLDDGILSSLSEHLYSYSAKIYIAENKDKIWAFVPNLFYSSSFVLAVRFDIDSDIVLKLIKNCDEDIFVFSNDIMSRCANMSPRVRIYSDVFGVWIDQIKSIFLSLDRLGFCANFDEAKEELFAQCRRLANFSGCQIEIEDFEVADFSAITDMDFPLFTAFVLTMLFWARCAGAQRRAEISFKELSKVVCTVVKFDFIGALRYGAEMIEWEHVSSEKLMPFGMHEKDGAITVGFQPYRREFSYLGIKQIIDLE